MFLIEFQLQSYQFYSLFMHGAEAFFHKPSLI